MERRYRAMKKRYPLLEVMVNEGEAKLIAKDKSNQLKIYSVRIPHVAVVVKSNSSSDYSSYTIIGNERSLEIFEDAYGPDIRRRVK